jgi:hypothetical protein
VLVFVTGGVRNLTEAYLECDFFANVAVKVETKGV